MSRLFSELALELHHNSNLKISVLELQQRCIMDHATDRKQLYAFRVMHICSARVKHQPSVHITLWEVEAAINALHRLSVV